MSQSHIKATILQTDIRANILPVFMSVQKYPFLQSLEGNNASEMQRGELFVEEHLVPVQGHSLRLSASSPWYEQYIWAPLL